MASNAEVSDLKSRIKSLRGKAEEGFRSGLEGATALGTGALLGYAKRKSKDNTLPEYMGVPSALLGGVLMHVLAASKKTKMSFAMRASGNAMLGVGAYDYAYEKTAEETEDGENKSEAGARKGLKALQQSIVDLSNKVEGRGAGETIVRSDGLKYLLPFALP